MKILAIFLLSVVATFGADNFPSQPLLKRDVVTAAAKVATSARFPDADSVLVDDLVSTVYNADGTDVTWDDEYTKILTEKGRRDASTLSLPFDVFYGAVRVVRAEIIKPDGRVVNIDIEANSRVMIDHGQMGMNIYDPNMKRLSLSLPGLESGDIRHLLICRETRRTRMPDTWCDYQTFEGGQPILSYTYTVSAPTNRPIVRNVLRAAVSNTVSYASSPEKDGRVLHTWKIHNVPQMFPEPDMPDAYTVVQRVLLSTIPDWQTVSRWYWKLCEKPLSCVTTEMREKVAELTRNAKTREEKIHAIFTFVSQKIRYMGVTTEDVAPGYEPHDVSVTFKNRYGVCRDKAALLVALLRIAEIPAYPVLITVGPKKDAEIPQPYFNHAITAVAKEDGGYQLMDSTNESTPDLFPAYLGNCSYLVATEKGDPLRVSEIYPAEKELLRVETKGTLDETGAGIFTSTLHFDGINDDAYRRHFLRSKKEERRGFFERVLKARLAGAEVLECRISPENLQDTKIPLSVKLMFRAQDIPVRGEKLDSLSFPWLGTALGYANFLVGQTGLKERKYPLMTEIACGVKEKIILDIRTGMGKSKELPPVKSIDRGKVEFLLDIDEKNGILTAQRNYLIKTVEFSPSEYQLLKNTLEEIEAADKYRPLFAAKGRNIVPDQETLYDKTETTLHSPTSWSSLHTWSKRILTYNGAKKSAEVKISYNPSWQTVELISAVVSNKGGKVFHAGKTEIHTMDAAWVADAPRYPAGKQLVVNLPGVEVGSVITIATRFTQKDALFYSHCQAFGGFEPVYGETYSLTYSRNLHPHFRLYNPGNVEFSSVTNAEQVTCVWSVNHLPPVKKEASLPPWHFYQPTLYLSFGNWKDFSKQISAAVEEKAKDGKVAEKMAEDLVKGCKNEREKVLAIRNEIMRTVRISGPSFTEVPVSTFSTPDRILADRYGNSVDRAILLTVMLKAVGVDAEFVLDSVDTTMLPLYALPSREIPQVRYFRNPLVRVRSEGKEYWLNEGTQYNELESSSFDGSYLLTLRGTMEKISVPPSFRDDDRDEMTVDIDESGTARITITNWCLGSVTGTFRQYYKEMVPEDLRRHTLEKVGKIAKSAEPISMLRAETDAYPAYCTVTVLARNYAIKEGDFMTLSLPDLAVYSLFPVKEDARDNPVFLSDTKSSCFTCRILFPKGYSKLSLSPKSFTWNLPDGVGKVMVSVQHKKNLDGRLCVTIQRNISYASGVISPQMYPALLEYNRLMSHPSVLSLVVEKVQ